MLAAIIRQQTGELLATWRDDAVADAAGLPLPPDACAWAVLAQALYDQLVAAELFDGQGRPIYGLVDDGAGSYDVISVDRAREQPHWYAIVRTSDRAIVGLDTAQGALPAGREYIEISRADWGAVNAAPRLADGGGPAWTCSADGTVGARADDRYVLRLSTPGGQSTFLEGDVVQISAQLEQADGTQITGAGGTREAPLVRTIGADEKRISVALVNGAATMSKALPAGRYRIASGEPTIFRCAGVTELEVAEAW